MRIPSAVRHLIEHSPLPMLMTDGEEHVVVDANAAFSSLCARPLEALIGRPLAEALPEYCGDDGLRALLDRVYRTGEAEIIADLPHADPGRGTVYWSYAAWALRDKSAQPDGSVVQVADTTEAVVLRRVRDQSDADLRAVNQALVIASVKQHELAEAAREVGDSIKASEAANRQSAVLEERNRIAREIHDTMAQAFTGIIIQLRVALRILEERPADAYALMNHVIELAQYGLVEARRSVWSLQPEAEEYSDLANAFARLLERAAPGHGAELFMHVTGEPRPVPPDVGMNLIRIGEEALTNALVHGSAQFVWVELEYDPERVVLRIQDDGCGFDPERQSSGGFGLISMRQRAERLGGGLAIASQPGRGAEVAVIVPVISAVRDGGAS